MSKIAVVLLTYERTQYAERALYSLGALIGAQLHIHIADDGSRHEHRQRLFEIACDHVGELNVTVTNSARGGYGKNYNLAMQTVHNLGGIDAVLPLEDDWELTRVLDVEPLLRALNSSIGVECIRLGYLAFTQALWGRVMSAEPEWYKYLLLDPDSAEPHVFAGHPRLETIEFEKRVGPWPEGLLPGQTEFEVAHRPAARRGVAWPMDLAYPTRDPLFAHIGTIKSTDVNTVEQVSA